ncbi:MAG: hypothetical protein BGO14_08690 [Chlamydiales bacterium 38-26]|nr:MAG: hypothetical protein BGO14_08690 [Chlamydiales bacterium 38-26]
MLKACYYILWMWTCQREVHTRLIEEVIKKFKTYVQNVRTGFINSKEKRALSRFLMARSKKFND